MRAALVLLLAVAAATAAPEHRIVGGSDTTILRYPYMASMQYNVGTWWLHVCGGSLITTTSVLSAAQCYSGADHPSEWQASLGSAHALRGVNHYASAFILHPSYSRATRDSDIAIVKLDTPAVLSATIGLARIAGPNYNLPDGTQVNAIGWGNLWDNGPRPVLLQHVDLNLINQEICRERYERLKEQAFQNWPSVLDNMLCSGILDEGGKDVCDGDDGGPIVHDRDVVVGIISWGYSCANPEYPGVSVRVSSFTDWIVENAS